MKYDKNEHHRYIKKTTNSSYKLPEIITEFSRRLFDLKEIQHSILLRIAEDGPMNKSQIKNTIGLTKRVADWNTHRLAENGYLAARKSTKVHREIKNAFGKGIQVKPILYHLTFKGLLASLEVPLEENYLIQNFLKIIESYTDQKFSELFFDHMKYCTALFILINYMRKTNLSEIGNVEWAIYDMYDWSKISPTLTPSDDLSFLAFKNQEIFRDLVDKFHISSLVIGNLTKQFKDFADSKVKGDMRGFDLTEILFRGWATIIAQVYRKNYRALIEGKVENPSYRDQDIDEYDYYFFEREAESIYKKLRPEGQFDPNESLLQV
ncbi:MAG: hypothetical protein ACT4N5_03035 [Nitrosopumilaceae archaeon]